MSLIKIVPAYGNRGYVDEKKCKRNVIDQRVYLYPHNIMCGKALHLTPFRHRGNPVFSGDTETMKKLVDLIEKLVKTLKINKLLI